MPPSLRAINRARIISLIRRQPGLTRADVSRLSGLSKGTVSNHVAELLEEGFLYQKGGKQTRRRNVGLRLNRNAGVVVGIELAPDECRGVLTGVDIRPIRRVQRRLQSTGVEETIDALLCVTEELLADVDEKCLGVVVGVPGPCDSEGETLVFSESLGWSDVPLAARLAEQWCFHVKIINRSRAGALGEHWYGAGVDVDDLIYVSISSGIAAGILIGGELFTGARGFNGELGHTSVLLDGPECICGNHGCLETVASLPSILRSLQTRLERGESSVLARLLDDGAQLKASDVVAAARGGDRLVLDEVRKASRYMGVAVANLVNLFNPSRVIIGGQLAEVGEMVVNTIRNTVQRRAYPLSFSGLQIVSSGLGPDSVCIGACAMVVDHYIAEFEPAMHINIEAVAEGALAGKTTTN